MTSASLIDPPGWMIALTPAAAACSIESAFGKNASLASVDPFARSPALSAAIFTETTLDIWPAPTPTVLVPWQRTMAFDFTCLATTQPKRSDSISSFVGFVLVTTLRSASVTCFKSLSWASIPPTTFLRSTSAFEAFAPKFFTSRSLRFFLAFSASSAFGSYDGAMMHSTKSASARIVVAVSRSTGLLNPTMPPNALRRSQSSAST